LKKKILGLYGSPRRDGNTDILLKEALRGAREAGFEIKEVFIRGLRISPCSECRECEAKGLCVIDDDMQGLYSEFFGMDGIILASPIFFYGLTAQTKMLIDRCQCMWARKYMFKKPVSPENSQRRGAFISVGATKGQRLFDGVVLTVKYFFDAIDVVYYKDLLLRGIDGRGDIKNHPDELKMAYALGKELLQGDS